MLPANCGTRLVAAQTLDELAAAAGGGWHDIAEKMAALPPLFEALGASIGPTPSERRAIARRDGEIARRVFGRSAAVASLLGRLAERVAAEEGREFSWLRLLAGTKAGVVLV